MELTGEQRRFVKRARVGRLATVDPGGQPHVVPVCYVLLGDVIGHVLDEKPKSVEASRLRRVQNLRGNPRVCLLVDRYREDWDRLGWVQVRGEATLTPPDHPQHGRFIRGLRTKYPQYESHSLTGRPLIRVRVEQVHAWGDLDPPPRPPDFDG